MITTTKAHIRSTERHVDVDVGKSLLDVYVYELNVHWQAGNTPAGIKQLVRKLRRYQLTRVLVEATGSYERAFVEACADQPLPVIVVALTARMRKMITILNATVRDNKAWQMA